MANKPADSKERINFAVGRVATTLEELIKVFEKTDDTIDKDSVAKVFTHLGKLFSNAHQKAALSFTISHGFSLDDPLDETPALPIIMPDVHIAPLAPMNLGPIPPGIIPVFGPDGKPEGRLIGQGKRAKAPHPLTIEGANDFLDDDE